MTRNPCPRYAPREPRAEPITISPVEVRVGELIGRGFDDETIARIIGCSEGTSRQYRRELEALRRRSANRGAG